MAKTCIGKSCNIFYHCLSGEVLVLYPCNNYWGIVINSVRGTTMSRTPHPVRQGPGMGWLPHQVRPMKQDRSVKIEIGQTAADERQVVTVRS